MRLLLAALSLSILLTGCAKRAEVVDTYPADDASQVFKQSENQVADDHVTQGKLMYRKAEYGQAIKHLIRALDNNPENWEAYYYLGLVEQKQGQYDRSIGAFNNCLKYAPSAHPLLTEVYLALGASWEKEGYMDKAKEKYTLSLSLNPEQPEAKAALERIKQQELKADAAKNKENKGAF
jgi:tetratricopeptide (TPR) repeat protein